MPSNNKTTPTLLALTEVSNYKNTDVVKHYGNMNMHVAINSKSPGVGLMTKLEGGEARVITCISNMFIGTSMYFDKVMPQRQADVIAAEILAKYEYRSLKLEDILAICIEIKEGDTFRLTPAAVLRYVKNYAERREALAIQNSIQRAQDMKGNFDNNYDERVKKTVRSIDKSNREIVRTNNAVKQFYK